MEAVGSSENKDASRLSSRSWVGIGADLAHYALDCSLKMLGRLEWLKQPLGLLFSIVSKFALFVCHLSHLITSYLFELLLKVG